MKISSSIAIDIGTTKICVLIAQQKSSHHIEIIGLGKTASQGLARGIIVDIAPAVESIKKAVQEAEQMAGITIDSACIGVSGSHIQSFSSTGMAPIKYGQVQSHDIAQVLRNAQAIPLPE